MAKIQTKTPALPSCEVVEITPAIARMWLEESKFDNRNLDERNVNKLARDIKKGRWVFDGNPIRFDKKGNVIDGQHRLAAILKSGIACSSMVVRGLDDTAKDTIDSGKARSVADILHFHGFVNNAILAGVCRYAIGWEENKGDLKGWAAGIGSRQRLTMQEILERARQDKGTHFAVQAILPMRFARKFMGANVAAFGYYILKKAAMDDAYLVDAFFEGIDKGENLKANDPILVLRNTLSVRDMKEHYTQGGNTMAVYRLALIIKAWNAWRHKKVIDRLKWDKEIEPFPVLV